MELKLSEQEQDALRKLASLGNVYHLLRDHATTLIACGLVATNFEGIAHLTDDGRKYLRAMDRRQPLDF